MPELAVPQDIEVGDIYIRERPTLETEFLVIDDVQRTEVAYYDGVYEDAGGILSRFGFTYRKREPDDVDLDGFELASDDQREQIVQVVENIRAFIENPVG